MLTVITHARFFHSNVRFSVHIFTRSFLPAAGWSRDKTDEENELVKLREENARLEVSMKTLTRELEDKAKVKAPSSLGQTPSYGELKLELIQTRQELNRAKDALQGEPFDLNFFLTTSV